MAREMIKIQSADGKAIKTIEKSAYAIYALRGWKEYKDNSVNKTDYTSAYSTTTNR
ncbi:MAG: hypothetical protein NC131_12860 [Roseburia sp.]|nr:hypothetical protein [Roseburia sp.]